VAGFGGAILTLDTIANELDQHSALAPDIQIQAQDPIYIIYTSGSTGKPKGALVTHQGEVNLQTWYTELCQFQPRDRTLIISAFGFDLTQKNLFAPLLCGAAVVVPVMVDYDAGVVVNEIAQHQVTHINCAPSALYAVVDQCDEHKAMALQSLRWVFLGGEPIRLTALQQWLQFPQNQASIVNSYGPTECADVVSCHVLTRTAAENKLIPVGKPICNTGLHILDEQLRAVPMGLIGEICISGVGLGLGYLGRAALTAEVFVSNPATGEPIYRTGDLGRFCPDGSVEYIGRRDFQVKVRGLRIELGEVEAAIKALPGITDAVVLVQDDALIGYALNADNQSLANWQGILRNVLPDYMVPVTLISVAQWPLTPNGKIDRKALPAPDTAQRFTPYVAPRNDLEQAIADTWAQVLHLDQVGVEDSFFDLGGHSLLANQIVSRLRKQFDIDLPIRDLILHPTVAALAQRVQQARRAGQLAVLEPVSRQQRIPLSAAQQRMWLLDQLEPGNPAYHVPSVITIRGDLNTDLVQQAFSAVINRHEGLRTFIAEDQQGPCQSFMEQAEWQLAFHDLRGESDIRVKQVVSAALVQPFDLASGPLFRAQLIQVAQQEYVLAVVLHHIITDGWSNGLLVRELADAYVQLLSNGAVSWAELPLHYADYAVWQQACLSATRQLKQAFWADTLADMPALEMPLDFHRPARQTFNGASLEFELPIAAATALHELGNRLQATPFMLLLAAWGAMLQRYSGQEQFAIGTPVAGRERPELETMAGFFVNTVAIPLAPDSSQSFAHLVEQVKAQALACFEHQDIPFEQIVEDLNPLRDMSRSPIFQVMLAYQNLPLGDNSFGAAELGNISLQPYEVALTTAKFEQTLTLWPTATGIAGALNYNTDLFSASTARQMTDHFIRYCNFVFQRPDVALHQVAMLAPEEQQQQLQVWNQTQVTYPCDRIEKLFANAAANRAGDIAVACGDQLLSYGELAAASDAVARNLIRCGVQPSQSVGIVLDRNLHLMSAILGVLKAGAVYIPIDANYPAERIHYICQQSGIDVVLTRAHLTANLPENLTLLDLAQLPQWASYEDAVPVLSSQVNDLIYVIYTSGSTGNPKGTGAYHRSEANLLHWYQTEFHMNADDRLLLLSAIGFDLTQKNLFAPLLSGARLVIPEFQEYDPQRIIDTIEREEISWINCAPSAFYPLLDNSADWPRLASLRYVFLGGEPINMGRLQAWLQQTRCQLINSYGPTECADIACWHTLDPQADSQRATVPIGRPNYNVQLYVLGEHQELLPRGAVGELCIGGDGVGPGYLNMPELTAATFITNPYQAGDTIYRTGDRVRYLANGDVEYLGRRDHQIKLRGYRVEVGEIQALLNRDPRVSESLVDVKKNASAVDQLVAWVATDLSESDYPQLVADLRTLANQHLPRFMVPDAWVVIASFSLTANGKIDRKALPLPEWGERKVQYVAPRNELEVALVDIWADVLHLDQVGIHDNFFELGGHSLLATQVAARVRSRLQLNLPIRELMSEPTIAALAPLLLRLQQGAQPDEAPLQAVDRNQRLPLSFAQQRLWLLDQIEPGSLAYTIPSVLRIRGPINPDLLRRALSKVLNRHEGLRTIFRADDEGPYQIILDVADWPLPEVDVVASADSDDTRAVAAEARRLLAIELMTPFDLASGPLFRNRLLRLSHDDHIFMVLIHHIVTDGWSMNLLIRDLMAAYVQLDQFGEVYFDTPAIQYADFAVWQRQRLDQTRQQQMLHYWQNNLQGVEPLNLPCDFVRPAVQTYNGNTIRFQIPAQIRHNLHNIAIEHNASLFASLLSGFFILLRQYSGQDDFCIGTPVAGRERAELEQVVGFFVNTLAIRSELSAQDSFVDILQRVRDSLMAGYANQEMPFEQIVEAIDPSRDMSRSPLFQVMLAYQNLPLDQQSLGEVGNVGDIQVEPFNPGVDASKYEITLTLWDEGEGQHKGKGEAQLEKGLGASLQYNTDLFRQDSMERLGEHLTRLLAAVGQQPEQPIKSLDYLSAAEREQQLVEWNLTDQPYDKTQTLDRALTYSLNLHGPRTAIVCGTEQLTYQQLDQQSAQLANLLRQQGVNTGDRVALCVDRHLHLMTLILGVVRAGACYVPLDASYPQQRIEYILQNADCKLILSQAHLRANLPAAANSLVAEELLPQLPNYPAQAPQLQVDPEQLLYVIFTSGSTGNPKGTGAYHRSEMNLLHWYCNQFNMTADDRVLLLSALGFDLTQKNLFAPLLQGACLVIPDFNEFDGEKITGLMAEQAVSWLNCAPSAFYALQDETAHWQRLRSMRILFLGGEAINVPRIADWMRQSRCQLFNSYGPTECADIATWYPVEVERDIAAPALPIGRPSYNVKLYVLGDGQELLPIGAVGELCIAGDGVGPGYINNPEQTSASFIDNPYANDADGNTHLKTLYRTGDRVRYRPDGNIEYLGRRDHQIKLRGYRIEAGEIQSVLNHLPGVRDSLVDIVRDSQGVQRLVAWVVQGQESSVDEMTLKSSSHEKLPAFMVPEQWLLLTAFPLTPNGKVDRKALPQPQWNAAAGYVAPATTLELTLCDLWRDILGVQQVGVTDSFFALGGQSLLATRLVSRMSAQLGRTIAVRTLFENPTIQSLLQALAHESLLPQRPALVRRADPGRAPLSYGQQRLWFFEQMNPGSAANNMPVTVAIKGMLDDSVLQKAFTEVCRRHESLRTIFTVNDEGLPEQQVLPAQPFNLTVVDLAGFEPAEQEYQLHELINSNNTAPFDLGQGPLLRASLVKSAMPATSQHLLLCMHHIVSDGASQVVLFRELLTLYLAYLQGQPSPLPELRIQYGDYSHWQRQWLSDDNLSQQLDYWRQQLDGVPALLELPLDFPRPAVQTDHGAAVQRVLAASTTGPLLTLCEERGVTPFMATLLAWQVLLYRVSGQADISVGVPTLGRHSPELENVIGFFIQSLVLRNRFGDNPLLADALAQTRQTVLDGFANGDVPVDRIVEHLHIQRNPAYTPLVQVAFQLLDGAGAQLSQLTEHAVLGDLEVNVQGSQSATAKFDLTLNLVLEDQQLSASLEYNTDLFLETTALRLLEQFERVCQHLTQDLQQPVATLDVLTTEQLLQELALDSERVEAVQPLSRMQHDMFMDNLVHPDSLQSSHGWNIHIHRPLDLQLWQQALDIIVAHQPMLRCRFVAARSTSLELGYLAIDRHKTATVEIIDLMQQDQSVLTPLIQDLIYRPYDLQQDELVRYYAIRLAPDQVVVVTAVHHAILDGAALNVLWQQWTDTYNKLSRGETVNIEPVAFADFIALDRQQMDTAHELAFWQQRLASVEPLACPAPAFAELSAGDGIQQNQHLSSPFITRELVLSDAHWTGVKAFCRSQRITPSLYFKCLYGYLIQQYCRSDHDFAIQETMGGRNKGHYEALGCYIQEIPFVFEQQALHPAARFIDLLEYARHYQKTIKDHRHISIGKQLELSPRGRIGFMYNFYQFLASSEFLGQQFSPEGTPSDPAANVQFVVTEVAGNLKLNLFFHQEQFADHQLLARVAALSDQVLQNPAIRLGEFATVTAAEEKIQLLESWNNTRRNYDLSLCVHQKFEQQVLMQPHATAIVDDAGSYTYQELNQRANQLAHYLLDHNVQPNDLVGLCAERSCDFLVGILGIMKAGAAYVPMDPKYPDDRIQYMIENSQVAVLVTQAALLDKSAPVAAAIHRVCLDQDWPAISTRSGFNPNLDIGPRNRAYMIYTSGSTGLPKGAIIRHDGAVNHIEAECEELGFAGAFSFLQTAPASSDISVWQFVGPITRGGQVVVLDDVTHSEKLFRLLQQHPLHLAELVPVALQLLMEYVRALPESERTLPSLRWMMATGEAVSVELVNAWLALYPRIPVVNAYGPTEAADDVIQCAITEPLPAGQKHVPIGKPLGNLTVYILDDQLRLVPAGVAGEICIGGIGVGEGYWQNPEKTAQAFVHDPFSSTPGAKLYRTGDLGRWLSDGSVEYLDRVDNQVKVRGFRIELGEVEAALSALPGVRECVVIVRNDMPGGAALAAYMVSATDVAADAQSLRGQLRASLPDFMVPAAITVMPALPLTPAGKVDRKALPRPALIQQGGGDYVAPVTDTETRLVEIWEALLPVERIGITDNFFELGGHSLIGVRIIARVNTAFGTNLQVASLLRTQTIAKLASLLDDLANTPQSTQQQDNILVAFANSAEHVESVQPGKSNLFLFHPVGGDVLCYADLARALQDDYAIYGLRAVGLDGTEPPASDLAAMVARYVAAIRTVQPHGPYQLMGQSLGGILALAVARQLETEGETVADIVLLDSFSPAHLRATQPAADHLLAAALGLGPSASPWLDAGAKTATDSDSYLQDLYQLATRSGVLPAEMSLHQFAALYRVVIQNHHLCSQYEVEKVTAKVHHFTAADNKFPVGSGLTWQDSLPELNTTTVAGGHESLMQGANARTLSDLIRQRLQTMAPHHDSRS